MNMKKILTLILILAMILPAVISCADGSKSSGTSETNTGSVVQSNSPADDSSLTNDQMLMKISSELPARDFEGYEYIVLTRDEAASPYWFTRDVFSEGLNGEPINDAVYDRNRILEEKFNIKVLARQSTATPATPAKTAILAGEDSFAAFTDGLNALSALATANLLLDYNELPGIKLENNWWDQAMNSGMSIQNRLYFVTGDISIMDNEGTWHVLFNKDIAEGLNFGNLYDVVNDGKWTLDTMYDIAKKSVADLDGDGVMTPWNDRFGLASEPYNTYSLWVGSGMKIATKNSDDLPELTMYSDRSVQVIDKALKLQLDKEIFIDHNTNMDIFMSSTVMFQLVGMRVLPVYRQSDINFGILPIPKFDEIQENHYTSFSTYNLTAYSVPITTSDPERTGILLEATAALSKYTLTPAYYEISLKGKALRDNESETMIDIILENRLYDIGVVFNWGGLLGIFTAMTTGGTNDFASRYSSLESKAEADMQKFIDSLE